VGRVLALIALCFPLFFVGLDAYDLDTKGEPREAFTAWEMLHSGEWALPKLNGETLPEKPLVFPWLVALSTSFLGEGGNVAPRLPSAILATGLVLVVFALGKKLQGEGVLPALVCATTTLVVMLGRRARVDMTLTFFVSLSLLLFLKALDRPRWSTLVIFWLVVALGTLTKGPIGAILPGLAIGMFLLLEKRWDFAPQLLAPLPVYLIVAGSWYANGLHREGWEFAHQSFLMENIEMYLGADTGGGHAHRTFYYFKYLPWQLLPWTLSVPPALWLAWRSRRERRSAFPIAWLVPLFIFFSIGRGKRGDYMLPLMPAFALLVADFWRRDSWALRTALFLGAGLIACGLMAFPLVRPLIPIEVPGIVLAGGAVAGIVPALLVQRGRRRAALAVTAGGMTLVVLGAVTRVMPTQQVSRPFASEIERAVGDRPLFEYNLLDFTSIHYLRRRIPTLHEEAELERAIEGGGFVIVPLRAWPDVRAPFRDAVAVLTSDRVVLGKR
jgi:4-amino-4-deoxy-L-arabinose transferase-like glycosyltransferase